MESLSVFKAGGSLPLHWDSWHLSFYHQDQQIELLFSEDIAWS